MKKLIFAVSVAIITLIGVRSASAAEGSLAYEAASSSWIVHSVSISTSVAVDASISTTTAGRMVGYKAVTWYSWTMFNVHASSFVYTFTPMNNNTAPTLSCADGGVGAPISIGHPTSPSSVTEQTIGMKPWLRYCGAAAANIKIGQRGR